MIIAIDGNEANVKNRVGVNQFAFNVMWGIHQIVKSEQGTVNSRLRDLKFTVFLREKPLSDLPEETEWWKYEVFGPKSFWTWTGLVKRLYFGKPRPDVLFTPSHYGPLFSPIPYIVSIMDLGFLQWPEQFTKKDFYQLKCWTAMSVKRAKKIVAISEFTKNDINKIYGIDKSKIVVAYPGYKQVKSYSLELKNLKRKFNIKGDYILYLGTLKPSKNVEGLVKAFGQVKSEKLKVKSLENIKLVIVGKRGWLYQSIFSLVKRLKLTKDVIFTDFVTEEEKDILLKGASLFVMPSFWEGFGIPVLDAFEAEVPVVCSDRGSLPEVAGEAAILVNPDSVESIAEGIQKGLFNDSVRAKLIKLGKERTKEFSWEKCSRIILDSLCESISNF